MISSTVLLFALVSQLVVSSEIVSITTPDDYYAIQQDISTGVFDRTQTISLDADLDFSNFTEILEPIGNATFPFSSTFLGNNHTISNFNMHVATHEYSGFFGHATDGAIIRDLIFDDTCSVTSAWQGSTNAYVGGVLGDCLVTGKAGITAGCQITNVVYMGIVTYVGSATNTYIGAIAGYVKVTGSECRITSCVSGGVLSTSTSTTKNAYMGGIMGTAFSNFMNPNNVTIDRCISLGKSYNAKVNKSIGAILGKSTGNNTISNCVYNKSAFARHAGSTNYAGSVFDNMMGFEDSFTLASDGSAMKDAVDAFVQEGRFGELVEWMFEKHTVTFNTNGGHSISPMETFPIMSADGIPSGEKYFYVFDGWTLDKEGKVTFSKSVFYDKDIVVYAKWKFMWQMFGMIFDIFFVVVVTLIFIYDVINPHFYF